MASPASAPSVDLQAELLGEADRYDGIILDADSLPNDSAEFSARLEHSLKVWLASSRCSGLSPGRWVNN
jgi:hypothetical protein